MVVVVVVMIVGEGYPVCITVARPAQLPAHTPLLSEDKFHLVNSDKN